MKTFLIIFILLLSKAAAGSTVDSVKKYYELVNKAELLLIKGDYTGAGYQYAKAFDFKFPNIRDERNAYKAACLCRDSILVRHYAKDLEYKSFPSEFLAIEAIDSAADPCFFEYITSDLDSVRQVKVFPKSSYELFEALRKADRNVRLHHSNDSMLLVDSINMVALKQFVRDYGFPTFDPSSPAFCMQPSLVRLFFLLWHQRGRIDAELDSILAKAVWDGNLPPEQWLAITMYSDSAQDKFLSRLWLPENSELTNRQIADINRNRAKYYLETIEDYQKKFDQIKLYERSIGSDISAYPFSFLIPWLVPPDNVINTGFR